MFDFRAANRRFGARATYSRNLAVQLKTYCTVLKHVRRGAQGTEVLSPEELTSQFWTAFCMLSENDGRNERQLAWAGLREFVDRFVRTRLWEGRENHNNWPAESNLNALALWLLWFVTDEETLAAETPEQRKQIMELVRPYVVVALRYPAFHAPDNHFDFPLPQELQNNFPYTLVTPHGFYPLYRQPDALVETFKHYNMSLEIAAPPITIAAKLLYFARSEVVPFEIPTSLPLDRADAIARGRLFPSPTQADYVEFNSRKGTKLVEKGDWDWRSQLASEVGRLEDDGVWRKGLKAKSALWDNDWQRWTCCWNPWTISHLKGVVYTYGTLVGLWTGRMLIPDMNQYFALITSKVFPDTFSTTNPMLITVPIYMRLREHHCINPEYPTVTGGAHDGFDDGIRNGWFPDIKISEGNGYVRIEDQDNNYVSKYETYVEGRPNSHSEDTCTQCRERKEEEEAELRERVDANKRMSQERERTERAEMKRQQRLASAGNSMRTMEEGLAWAEPVRRVAAERAAAAKGDKDVVPDDDTNNNNDTDPVPSSSVQSEEPDAGPSTIHRSPTPSNTLPHPGPSSSASFAPSPPPSVGPHSPEHEEPSVEEIHESVNAALGPNSDLDSILDFEMGSDKHDDAGSECSCDHSGSDSGSESGESSGSEYDYVENTCNGIQDIIITGETLPRHGQAWHHYRFYGRVRRWDGLLALVRVPMNHPELGIAIFRGYVTNSKNFVGSWRAYTSNVNSIPLEGPFVLSRAEVEV
ncbi:hypothetical protein C8Q75DRAFT_807191 [Abortiporus biennis]|nr:hypothetical protein C8Q75DRAFT_807191 [Abortiporus biennis]